MGICTLIAIVSCRMSPFFFEPTVEWGCMTVLVNGIMVFDIREDKEEFSWAYELHCEDDWAGEDLFSSILDAPACEARPRPVLVVDWAAGRSAHTPAQFISAVCGAIREGFRALGRIIEGPVCAYATAVECNEGRPGLQARPLASIRRASQALHSVSLNGSLISRDEIDEEVEWLGVDGRFAAEQDQWYDDYVGSGVCSCEKGRIGRGWEHPTDRHTGRNRNRMARDRSRQLARRIKQELLGC